MFLNGSVVVLADLVCDEVSTSTASCRVFSKVVCCLIGVSRGMFTGTETDLENTLFFSLVSPSSIFLFLRPGLAGLMGSGRQEEEELSPSGLTEQKMHGS